MIRLLRSATFHTNEWFLLMRKALMGQEYPYTQLGKPHQVTFDYAERMLSSRLVAQGGEANEPLPTV
jgi:hypothetical protein